MTSSGRNFEITIDEHSEDGDVIGRWSMFLATGNDRNKVLASLDRAFHELLDQVVPTEE